MRNEVGSPVSERKLQVTEAVNVLVKVCDEVIELAAQLDAKTDTTDVPLAEVLQRRVDTVSDACCILRDIKDRLEL